MNTPALISVQDAAEILFGNKSRSAYKRVLKLIHDNELRSMKNGSRYYVVRSAVEDLL